MSARALILRAKILNLKEERARYETLDLSKLNLRNTEKELSEQVEDSLIKKYYVTCFKNKKQLQQSNRKSGRKKVEKPSGTNKGLSRQPRGSNGRARIVVNVPNAVGGGQALPFTINKNEVRMNKKEKKTAIKLLLHRALKRAELYVVDGHDDTSSDSQFLKQFKKYCGFKLKAFLNEPVKNVINCRRIMKKGLIVISETDQDFVLKKFRNYRNIDVLNEQKTNYFCLLNGCRLPSWIITTRPALEKLLLRIHNEV